MTTKDNETLRARLTQVNDIDGADSGIRAGLSVLTDSMESASVALREAVGELHQAEDDAWRRYARDVEHATLGLDSALGMASARLRAERAATKKEIGHALQTAAQTWRARADEVRVQTHLGEMEARDQGLHALADLELAGHRITEVINSVRADTGESLTALRASAQHGIDELGRVLHDLGSRRTGSSPPPRR